MRPDQYKITELIPQREPMVMIDKLIYADEKSAKGILFIRESNMFIHQNKLSEAALIEFMAQTAAASERTGMEWIRSPESVRTRSHS